MKYIISFIGSALALFITVGIVDGIYILDLGSLIIATIIVGLLNTFIRPILRLISLPITLVTFGLFSIVINAGLFALAAFFAPGFQVNGIIAAFAGAIVLSITSTLIDFFVNRINKKDDKKKD